MLIEVQNGADFTDTASLLAQLDLVITEVLDRLPAEYRNVFAHFSTDEPMSPLNPEDEERMARASVVLKRTAIDAIGDARNEISELAAAGLSETNSQQR